MWEWKRQMWERVKKPLNVIKVQSYVKLILHNILVTWYSRLPTNEYYTPKAKGLFIKLKYLKISGIDLKKRCKDKKWSNVINCKKPNEKFQRYVIIFLWEIINVHFYDWDRSPDLVLFVYDLIELIIKASL